MRDVPFSWGSEQQTAFKALKAALKVAPVLVYPDYDKEFFLYTDASGIAIGAILAQLDEESHDHLVA